MRNKDIIPESSKAIEIVDSGTPSVPDQVSGNHFGWGKINSRFRWLFWIILILLLAGILAEFLSVFQIGENASW